MDRAIAFVTYETQAAPCGGIAAVMARLPEAMAEVSGGRVWVITPYHHRVPRMARVRTSLAGVVVTQGPGGPVSFNLMVGREGTVHTCYLLPDRPEVFAGASHPYDLPPEALLQDAMAFGRAAAAAAHLLEPGRPWSLFLQDWEAAFTALAPGPERVSCWLTLHNSYDSRAVWPEELARWGYDTSRIQGVGHGAGPRTALSMVLSQWVERPALTVSEGFAEDLVSDPLQTKVMAPHLTGLLAGNVLGLPNGPFQNLRVPEAALAGDPEPLMAWKGEQRALAMEAISAQATRVWGDTQGFLERARGVEEPWFVMSGRDDPRQKGFDVAAAAARVFLARGGRGSFLFLPQPGDEGLDGLGFLRRLAMDFPARVLVMPFRLERGYLEIIAAAAYGLMPSLYEPFGMANELYMNGTAALARATGGLRDQIVGHGPARTGILFREKLQDPGLVVKGWAHINDAGYLAASPPMDRVEQRSAESPYISAYTELFRAMVRAMADGLVQAGSTWEDRRGYAAMVARGVEHITRSFSWADTATRYLALGSARAGSPGG